MQEQRLSVAGLWGLCAGDGLGLLARPKAVRNAQHGSLSVMRLLVAWHGNGMALTRRRGSRRLVSSAHAAAC